MNEEERLEKEEHAKQMLEDALYDEEKEKRAGFFKEIPECKMCDGKGYYNLSSSYDDIHSRILCECEEVQE